jgi:hypothetical protein
MPESIQALMQSPAFGAQLLLAIVVVVGGLLTLYSVLRAPLRRWRQEREITRAVKRLGARVLNNVHLPDGLGGEVVIDHLLLAGDAILVINVKRFEGLIFGGEHTEIWTQVINTRSYKFPNPDDYLKLQLNAVRSIAPKAAVRGLHLFTHDAQFPKGKPPTVELLEDLDPGVRRPRFKQIPGELRAAWEDLATAAS